MRVPAVVGSWPQPFLDGYDGRAPPGRGRVPGRRRRPARRCASGWRAPASTLAAGSPEDAIRVLVGPWARVREDPAAAQIEDGPAGERRLRRLRQPRAGGYVLRGLGEDGEVGARLRPRRRPGRRDPSLRSAAGLGGHRGDARPACARPPSLLDAADLRDHYAVATEGGEETPLPRAAMRSPFAYTPRPRPLQAASPGAAVAYLGALDRRRLPLLEPARARSRPASPRCSPACSPGRGGAVRAALWMGLALALLIVVVNALVVNRGETVLARLGEWPLFGQVDVTAEAIAAGAVLGLRAAVVMVAFAVYSACVDPDRVLRALRPLAGRSALTATLVSRLVPVAAADAAPPARRRPPARPGRRPGRPRAAGPPPARRLARPRRRRRRHPGAARLLPRRRPGVTLHGMATRFGARGARRLGARATTGASTRSARWCSSRRSPAKAARRRRLPRLPDGRGRHRLGDPRPLGPVVLSGLAPLRGASRAGPRYAALRRPLPPEAVVDA